MIALYMFYVFTWVYQRLPIMLKLFAIATILTLYQLIMKI